jgi:hypothetical protein
MEEAVARGCGSQEVTAQTEALFSRPVACGHIEMRVLNRGSGEKTGFEAGVQTFSRCMCDGQRRLIGEALDDDKEGYLQSLLRFIP